MLGYRDTDRYVFCFITILIYFDVVINLIHLLLENRI